MPSSLRRALLSSSRLFITKTIPVIRYSTYILTKLHTTPCRQHPRLCILSANLHSMSDSAYLDFLSKANKDYSGGAQPSGLSVSATASSTALSAGEPPIEIQKVINQERYFVSEVDEPFEAVTIEWKGAKEGSWPSAKDFVTLIHSPTIAEDIEILTVPEWDPNAQYTDVTRSISSAPEGVKVYKALGKGSRVYYYILGIDESERGRLVGFKVLSVES